MFFKEKVLVFYFLKIFINLLSFKMFFSKKKIDVTSPSSSFPIYIKQL